MKNILSIIIPITVLVWSVWSYSSDSEKQKPVQHLKLEDINSEEVAKATFIETTAEIKSKTDLNEQVLQEIHLITYRLEKSIAYYAENSREDIQSGARKIAVVVEEIHLASENNQFEKTEAKLKEYFTLAKEFKKKL